MPNRSQAETEPTLTIHWCINASQGFNELTILDHSIFKIRKTLLIITALCQRNCIQKKKNTTNLFHEVLDVFEFEVWFNSSILQSRYQMSCCNGPRFNSSLLGQNGCHFTDDIFRFIFVNEKFCTSIKISLNFVPMGPINNKPALV